MKTNFVAFLNKHGIACASDTDMTLYALSKKEPVAVAVNPYSPIPWDKIINAYLRRGDIALHDDFNDYVRDFAEFLKTVDSQKKWAKLTDEEANIIFLGFGQDDLFPSGIDVYVRHSTTSNTLECELRGDFCISHEYSSDYCRLGGFELMRPVLDGISEDTAQSMIDMNTKSMNKYKERMATTLKKANCKTSLDELQFENTFTDELSGMADRYQHQVSTAIESFNIEDMVKVAETFVDANDQLEHLKGGGIGLPNNTKELAVITRTEGLTWIKHCIYGL